MPVWRLARVTRCCLLLCLLSGLVLAAVVGLQMTLIHVDLGGRYTDPKLWEWAGVAITWAERADTILFYLTAFPFLRWTYLVNRNALAFRREPSLAATPAKSIGAGWSVGFYFVPFANFWVPYQAMRETDRISSHLSEVSAARILPWWW